MTYTARRTRRSRPPVLLLLALALATGTGCNRGRDVRPWMVCYRVYEQCVEPTHERVLGLTQELCEAYVAHRSSAAIEAMVDCVRERPCPGIARACVEQRADTIDLTAAHMRPHLLSGFDRVVQIDGKRGVSVVQPRACVRLAILEWPRLALTIHGGVEPGRTAATITLNGHRLAGQTLERRWQRLEVTVSRAQLRRGSSTLCVDHRPEGHPPADRSPLAHYGRIDLRVLGR